jgi:ATP-binding protein involved in chromosome partitioning
MPVIVDADSTRASALATSVGHGSHVVSTIEQVDAWLARRPNEYAVLVGPEVGLDQAMAMADRLRLSRPGLGVLLLRSQVTTDVMAAAIRAGIREVLAIGDHEALSTAVERARETFNAIHGPTASDANEGRVITVFSPKGGVGKTTVAVNLAVALARLGHKVGLIDADIYGPNVPTMLGATRQPNIIGENRIEPILAHGVKFISIGLISPGDKPLVMRGPMLHQIIRQFLQQVEWGELDFLIIDLPPGTGDVVISLVQTVPLTGAVVVSTGSSVALEDARKALEMFHQVKVEVLGMVENMSQMTLPSGEVIDVFGAGGTERTAAQFGLDFLGALELNPTIREGGDKGIPVALAGPESKLAAEFYAVARRVADKAREIASKDEDVLEIS